MNPHPKPGAHAWMGLAVGLVSVILLTGCPLADAVTSELLQAAGARALSPPADPPFWIVGEDEGQFLFVSSDVSRGSDGALVIPPPPRDLLSVDPVTLSTEVVLADVATFPSSIVANGRWVAWADGTEGVVKVLNRASGLESEHYLGGASDAWAPGMHTLTGDRLLVSRSDALFMCDPPFWCLCTEYVLLDLNSGEQTAVTEHADPFALAMNDDYLAFTNCLPTDVDALSLEWTFNFELVDLDTGEGTVIASERRVSGSFDFYFLDERLLWQEYKPGGFESRLVGYGLETRETTTLFDDFDSSNDNRRLIDLSGDRMLVRTEADEWSYGGQTISLEVWTMDGDVIPVVEFQHSLSNPHAYRTFPRCVGDFVVWTDPMTGVFGIYDLESGSTRTFDPMTE